MRHRPASESAKAPGPPSGERGPCTGLRRLMRVVQKCVGPQVLRALFHAADAPVRRVEASSHQREKGPHVS